MKIIAVAAALAVAPSVAGAWGCPHDSGPDFYVSRDGTRSVTWLPEGRVLYRTPDRKMNLEVFQGGPGWGYAAKEENGDPFWSFEMNPGGGSPEISWGDELFYPVCVPPPTPPVPRESPRVAKEREQQAKRDFQEALAARERYKRARAARLKAGDPMELLYCRRRGECQDYENSPLLHADVGWYGEACYWVFTPPLRMEETSAAMSCGRAVEHYLVSQGRTDLTANRDAIWCGAHLLYEARDTAATVGSVLSAKFDDACIEPPEWAPDQ